MVEQSKLEDLVRKIITESLDSKALTAAFEELDQSLVSLSLDKEGLEASMGICGKLADFVLNKFILPSRAHIIDSETTFVSKYDVRDDVVSIILSNMAYIDRQNGKRREAIETAMTALNASTGNFAKGRVLEEMSLIYRFLNPRYHDLAIAHGIASAANYAHCSSGIKLARVNGIVGNTHIERNQEGDLERAEPYLQADLEFNCRDESGKGKFGEMNARHGLGKLYLAQGRYEEAFGQFNTALEMYRALVTDGKKEFSRGTVTLLIYAACAASYFDSEKALILLGEADARKKDSHSGDYPILYDVLKTKFNDKQPIDIDEIERASVLVLKEKMADHYKK